MKKELFRKHTGSVQCTAVEIYEGETIETKVERIVENNEPISDGAPIVYTERKDGVRPEYNIRTDKFEIALDAMDAVNRSKIAQSKQYLLKEKEDETTKTEETKEK